MNLFSYLPTNLFSVLSSENRELYIEALFVLRKAFKQEIKIRREDVVIMLIENLEDKLKEFTELNEVKEEIDIQTITGKVYTILRRLQETGWIDREQDGRSFEEYIILYDYSIKILNLLYEFTDNSEREYTSLVYSTYSALKTADTEKEAFSYSNALTVAVSNIVKLEDELKTLLSNIRRYHQMLYEEIDIKKVLSGHFDEFLEKISDKIYHPLKTYDSISRFKIQIINILHNWMEDNNIIEIIVAFDLRKKGKVEYDDKKLQVYMEINKIIDTLEKVDDIIREIDTKNSDYTRASVQKIKYMVNSDKSIKGKVIELIKGYSLDSDSNYITQLINENSEIYSQRLISEESFYMRTKKDKNIYEREKISEVMNEESIMKEMKTMSNKFNSNFSTEKIKEYMQSIIGEKEIISSKEIIIDTENDYILLMLGIIRHEEKESFYNVKFLNEKFETCIKYSIPNMIISKNKESLK